MWHFLMELECDAPLMTAKKGAENFYPGVVSGNNIKHGEQNVAFKISSLKSCKDQTSICAPVSVMKGPFFRMWYVASATPSFIS